MKETVGMDDDGYETLSPGLGRNFSALSAEIATSSQEVHVMPDRLDEAGPSIDQNFGTRFSDQSGEHDPDGLRSTSLKSSESDSSGNMLSSMAVKASLSLGTATDSEAAMAARASFEGMRNSMMKDVSSPLSQYLGKNVTSRETRGSRVKRLLKWFYTVPRTQNFNLRQLGIAETTDQKFLDIVENLMNVRCADADDLNDVSTMLRDTRQEWSFFDIVEAEDKSNFWVLRTYSILGTTIATIMALIAFYSSWYASLICAYDPVLRFDALFHPDTEAYKTLQRFDIALDLVFFLGALTELRTAVIDQEHFTETVDPHKIRRKRMLSVGFWMDLLSCAPASFVYARHGTSINWLVVKLVCRLRCTLAWLKESPIARLKMQPYWQSILRLLLIFVLLGHLLGCFWYLVSTPLEHPMLEAAGGGARWIDPVNADRPLILYYTYFTKTGLYLSLGIIVEGYSVVENTLIVILAPMGCVVNALGLSFIIVIVSRHSALETHALEQQAKVKQAVESQGLPSTIQLRLMAYHMQKRAHRCRTETQGIFRGLSDQLHFELNLVLYFNLIIEADIFKKSHPKVIRQIVIAFEDKLFLPGDYVCRYDDEGSEMYFISRGRLDVFSDAGVLLSRMKKGQHFGEIALLTGQRRTAYVQASMFCMLASLSKANFDDIMREFPAQLDIIMDQMSAKKKTWFQSLMQRQEKTQAEKVQRKKSFARLSSAGNLGAKLGMDEEDDEDDPSSPGTSPKVLSRKSSFHAKQLPRIKDSEETGGESDAKRNGQADDDDRDSINGEDAADSSQNALTMVIPFNEDAGSKADDAAVDKASSGANSSSQKDTDSDDSFSEPEASGEDSDEDMEELVATVSKQCEKALSGNERICSRLKEMCEHQAASAGNAEQVASLFARYFTEQAGQDRTVLLESICNDVDLLGRQVQEYSNIMEDESEGDSPVSPLSPGLPGDRRHTLGGSQEPFNFDDQGGRLALPRRATSSEDSGDGDDMTHTLSQSVEQTVL